MEYASIVGNFIDYNSHKSFQLWKWEWNKLTYVEIRTKKFNETTYGIIRFGRLKAMWWRRRFTQNGWKLNTSSKFDMNLKNFDSNKYGDDDDDDDDGDDVDVDDVDDGGGDDGDVDDDVDDNDGDNDGDDDDVDDDDDDDNDDETLFKQDDPFSAKTGIQRRPVST